MEIACARHGETGRLAALESCRSLLVTAMKEGNTLVIKIGQGGNAGIRFVAGDGSGRCFVAPEFLPSSIFEPGAVCNASVWNLFVRSDDMYIQQACVLILLSPLSKILIKSGREAGSKIFAIRPGFNVVVTSTCEAKSYRRTLHKLLPLHRMRVIQVPAPNPGHCASRNAHTLYYASHVARAATVPHQGCLITIEVFSHCYHH